MKTRAAVAWEAKKPLTIETVELDGPKAGEVLVEVMATGVCHTDAYTLDGLDSLSGTRYADSAAQRDGIVRDGKLTLRIRGSGVQVLAPE